VSVSIDDGLDPRVNVELVAVPDLPGWFVSSATNPSYQWYQACNIPAYNTWVPLVGATAATYTPGDTDLGCRLGVEMTVEWPTGTPVTESAETQLVWPEFNPDPWITGEAKAFSSVTGGINLPQSTWSRSCVWYNSNNLSVSLPSTGTGGCTFNLTYSHLGDVFTVAVTLTAPDGSFYTGYTFTAPVAPNTTLAVTLDNYAPQVGEDLTATVSGYPPGAEVSYGWFCDGGTLLLQSDMRANYSSTYTLEPSAIGCIITVQADVIYHAWSGTADDSTTTPVTPDQTPAVTLDNYAPQVGEVLTATMSAYPSRALVSYQWFLDGAPLVAPTTPAATSSDTYTLQPSDIGGIITVEATVSLGGWSERVDDSTTDPVAPPTLGLSLTGGVASKQGSPMTAVPSGLPAGWTCPTAGVCSFNWYRGPNPFTGIDLGTNDAAYVPGGLDVGYPLTVEMTVTWPNGSSNSVFTSTNVVAPITDPKLSITGKAEVGQKLTASLTDPTGTGQRFTCDWFRAGTTARVGTGLTYTVKATDAGKKLTATCTLTARGAYRFAPASASVNVKAVQPPPKPPKPPTPPPPPVVEHMVQVVESPSLVGRAYGDILAVDKRGVLWRYPSSASGKLGARSQVGTGWLGYSLYPPGDWNLDGKNDLVAVKGGQMYLLLGNGKGQVAKPVKIGHGWSPYAVVPAGDLTGDGFPDMLAVHKQSGKLLLYKGDGRGGFQGGFTQVGHRWAGKQLLSAGDLTKNGTRDILGVTASGRLLFFEGRGNGFFKPAIQVGHGWKNLTPIAGADLNGDGVADICTVMPNGDLNLYKGRGVGTFHKPIKIGSGF